MHDQPLTWREHLAQQPYPRPPSPDTPEVLSSVEGPEPACTPEGHPIPDFTPFVPQRPRRIGGWNADTQRTFIAALTRSGNVGVAAEAAGRTRRSAYQLRDKDGAESFAAAWDAAIRQARSSVRDASLDLAINGEALPVFRRGRFCGWRVKRDWRALGAVLGSGRGVDDHAADLDAQRWRLERWEVALRREALDRLDGVDAARDGLAEAEAIARIGREEAGRLRLLTARRNIRAALAAEAARVAAVSNPRIRCL